MMNGILRTQALILSWSALTLLFFSAYAAAYNRPLISWNDLIYRADLIVVGSVNAANWYAEDDSSGILVKIDVGQYLKGQATDGTDDTELSILMNVRINPVRVGSRGLFFIRKVDSNPYYELVDRDVGALEATAAFCKSKPIGSNWTAGYAARKHGGFLFDIPEGLLLDRKDCAITSSFESHIFAGDKASLEDFLQPSD